MATQAFHKKDSAKNAGNEHQYLGGEYFAKRLHRRPLALVAEANAELERLLPQ